MTPRLAVVLAALLIAGCSAEAKPAPKPSGDPHAYARALIPTTQALRETHDAWVRGCRTGDALACGLGALNLSITSETLTTELHTWADQSNPHHLVPLGDGDAGRRLTETTTDATAFAGAIKKYSDQKCNEAGEVTEWTGDCIPGKNDVDDTWSRLAADLTAWERYR